MTPEQWERVNEILGKALELSSSERKAYLHEACNNDPFLHREVQRLLVADDLADSKFLNPGTLPLDLEAEEEKEPDMMLGRRLGNYQTCELLGVGGMGEVYRAFRADDQYRKQVALKLVRSGQGSQFVFERFRNERQILASLDHPNIARLLDGGTTEEGAPYFVMELIEGQPLGQYCEERKLGNNDRLRLFLQVCSAVQFAHQRLVVHRDLKPSNILVTPDGTPKLLDFGVSKILDADGSPISADPTLTAFRALTPAYASPEQIKGGSITTATDVYSLGVVLYELLTGRSPYPVATRSPHEISHAICEVEPERPSVAVRKALPQEDRLPSDEHSMQPSLAKLSKQLRGDLDSIVLKALRKEPERRYASVEEFAGDIRRHLEHLPVVARNDTLGYRTSKFVRRHKAGVSAATAVATVLMVGAALIIREARIAERRFNDVRSLANSLIFDVHDSIKDLPGSTPARKLIVDRALQYLNTLSQESRGDLSLLRELATAYERVGLVQGHYLQNSLGDTKGSLDSYSKALSIRQQIVAKSGDWNDRLALVASQRLVANQQWALGNYSGAIENINAAVDGSESLNRAYPKNPKILNELSSDYSFAGSIQAHGYAGGTGAPGKDAENYRKAVETDKILLSITPDDISAQHAYATDLGHLGDVLNDLHAALECYKNTLRIDQELRQRSPDTRYTRGVAFAYSRIAQAYEKLGDPPAALENFTRGLEVSKELALADPKNALFQRGLAIAYANTAPLISTIGRDTQKGYDYIQRSDEIIRGLVALSPENRQERGFLAEFLVTNGSTLLNLGKFEAALKELDEARSTYESLKGIGIDCALCRQKMGEAGSGVGDSKLATENYQAALTIVEPMLQAQKPEGDALYIAADSYSGLGDLELRMARQPVGDVARQKQSWTQAQAWYVKSLAAWRRVENPSPIGPHGLTAGNPATVAKKLRLCDAALSSLH